MTTKHPSCRAIELDLVATATGDAESRAAQRVHRHMDGCAPCREEFGRYRAVDHVARGIRPEPAPEQLAQARTGLESRLADLRQRRVAYRIFPSPLGHILVGRSEHGIALVEYLGRGTTLSASRLGRVEGVEAVEGGPELERLQRDLLDFIGGRRRDLDWTLDWRLARSDFERAVLEATAAIPYGAVASYAGVARRIGKPSAVRAVAQALRWNPLPIVVPCHRVIGTSGRLTGYAGDKLGWKQQLLTVEGIKLRAAERDYRIAREAMYALGEGETEYCLPSCGSIGTRSLALLTLFASREVAEARGLAPCTSCRPDLHPLQIV
ncbi:MAG TPA: methylated-DNA--[protein]-cysteine S-methyltransferase [Methylomirabilota bacterium]|jgi:methylated-DNA-[protein]-cysteine S-methyltransferase|nr:methylated-DNA--[protein]-cysteine S-methyltransferase [Methylomirabilota bacterium]